MFLGAVRRSHTKSRKGCLKCKTRHIRCDEKYPQCSNCTKRKDRCPYNDMPTIPGSLSKPDLMWTPTIEAAIEDWKTTSKFPFPSLQVYPTPVPQLYSTEDLRLIYHFASLKDQLAEKNNDVYTSFWTQNIPTLLSIATTSTYVMHALCSLSATHIALHTNCPLVSNIAFEHRGLAFVGLHKALGEFSRENSDAILAASVLLSWQATDRDSWTKLMQGTSTIINSMGCWLPESALALSVSQTLCPRASSESRTGDSSSTDDQSFDDYSTELTSPYVSTDNHEFTPGVGKYEMSPVESGTSDSSPNSARDVFIKVESPTALI
ncbi:hypothetical protein DCS_04649 [Drechmeria coniospora]|uniref:Zn(2)-C6 fungal-type domain-containing protein n=1 Tax=Drechmeria coniospora TaxID=98403 RepID=A0A151GKL2_DRECN|nr:hypothetical protein DCS_04649 [Drechmeria coniospora]KYK57637.1 hypothetical protein DCS_04649 [Drechmeria coniospora]ODA79524.1 hypothetical protein RJ55_05117 [Drechmeria coniospora]